MAKTLDFQIKAINNTLGKLSKEMKKAKRDTELAAGRAMTKAIRLKTPISNNSVSKGRLRKSIGRITKLRRAIYTYIGVRSSSGNRKSGYYAKYLEYGKTKQAPKPFFKKAAASGVPIVRSILINGAKVGLKKYKIQNEK
tara:strand:- start:62 stop:481 length:420 start_codon:yes stop_codon:yes gene_type:complete